MQGTEIGKKEKEKKLDSSIDENYEKEKKGETPNPTTTHCRCSEDSFSISQGPILAP